MTHSYRQPEAIGFRRTGLDSQFTGSVNTGVLLWSVLVPPRVEGRWPLSSFCTITDSPTLGTTFKFTKPGRYAWNVVVIVDAADHSVDLGITVDGSGFITNPQPADPAMQDYARATVTAAAGISVPLKLATTLFITDEMAGTSTRGIVRIHCTDGADGAPADISTGDSACWCRWLGDLRGST